MNKLIQAAALSPSEGGFLRRSAIMLRNDSPSEVLSGPTAARAWGEPKVFFTLG